MISFARCKYRTILSGFLIAILFFPLSLFAATDTFIISSTITGGVGDTTAPSVPTNLTATAVSETAIDLTWTASTDAVGVTGYQVFRDSVQIATSTSISYSDTGLTADTTYTYYVTAFDAADNVSGDSDSDSATTLSTTGAASGGGVGLFIVLLEVLPGRTSAVLHFETSVPARSVILWGETVSYELGVSAEQAFSRDHEIVLTSLSPATEYKFQISGENEYGFSRTLVIDEFTTLEGPDVTAPSNVRNLTATQSVDDIVLTWENPRDEDFSHVRVLGNDRQYPNDAVDGQFIFEGSRERTIDKDVVVPGTTRYYTVFAYDLDGNISSGAIVAITIDEDGEVHIVDFDTRSFTEVPSPILLSDIRFVQDHKILDSRDGNVALDGSRSLLVILPYKSVPEHLKSIIMTIENTDESGDSFSFLLRINDDKSAYTAAIAPLGISGTFPFTLSLVDYKVQQIGKVKGILSSRINVVPRSFFSIAVEYLSLAPYFFLLLLLLLLIAYKLIRKSKKKAKTSNVE